MKKSIDSPRLCTKNDESKQRKVADEYVRLCGYKHGEIGKNHSQKCQNGISEKLTLSQIAAQLGTSKRDLQRALRIERNLTESMKELLDTGVINTQLGRRNLPAAQRLAVVEKFKKKIQEEAKENQSLGGGDQKSESAKNRVSPIGEKRSVTHTDKELAKLAGVGSGTVARYDTVPVRGCRFITAAKYQT